MNENAPLTWETLDWDALGALRRRFLASSPTDGPYWRNWSDLAGYDFTYAQRIGWKWDAVLDELRRRGWSPPPGPLLDWACGSGIAGRRLLEFFGPAHFGALRVDDRSPLAVRFALVSAREQFAGLDIRPFAGSVEGYATVAISHVSNELDAAGRGRLADVIGKAQAVLWVEPGTYAESRALIAFREEMLGEFEVIAPCTHAGRCGLLHAHNATHWCHHFARPPAGLLNDSGWVRFGQQAGIDLRSIPYSFLVLERRGSRQPLPGLLPETWSHVIGNPRLYKGFAKVLDCARPDVTEVELWQRDAPELLRAYRKGTGPTLLRGRREGKARLLVEETL